MAENPISSLSSSASHFSCCYDTLKLYSFFQYVQYLLTVFTVTVFTTDLLINNECCSVNEQEFFFSPSEGFLIMEKIT